MNDQNITCPSCGKEFPLSSTLTHQLNESIRKELKADYDKEKKEFIEKEKIEMWNTAQQKAKEKIDKELKDLRNEQDEKEKLLKEYSEKELLFNREKRVFEEKERRMAIEIEKQKDEARKEAMINVKKDLDEENRMKMAEKDKQLEQLNKTIQDLKRQSEQGSMQVQGDALETDLKVLLKTNFITDEIEDVATGTKGGDLIHTIKNQYGVKAGVILWECKNTKAFSNEWIKKLKSDMVESKADIAILITKTLPEDIEHFGIKDDVWIVENRYVLALTHTLRSHLMSITNLKQSLKGSDKKMELLYNYIYSNEFKNKYENIMMAFTNLKTELDQEKRALQKNWSRREKEIDRLITNTSSMYGDLEGTTGKKLPTIQSLELPGSDDEDTEDATLF